RGEVVCWNIFQGSFLCFLSTGRSGGGFLPASQDVGSPSTCLSTHSVLSALPVPLWMPILISPTLIPNQ
ncbi:hypothetical protein FQN60_010856, partial [Etheostoma spectabile]